MAWWKWSLYAYKWTRMGWERDFPVGVKEVEEAIFRILRQPGILGLLGDGK